MVIQCLGTAQRKSTYRAEAFVSLAFMYLLDVVIKPLLCPVSFVAPFKGAVELHYRFSTVGLMQVLPFDTSEHLKALPTSEERLLPAFGN